MGQGIVGARLRAWLLLGAIVTLGVTLGGAMGCQPLYGNRPEKLKNPPRKKAPPELATAATQVKFVEDCTANFRDDPKLTRPNPTMADQLVGDGDTALQNAAKAKDGNAQAELLKLGIDKYRNALIKDPYNADATLKLALAYDMVLRKGCALAMLKRLASMQSNPKYAKQANAKADEVTDNASWFKYYRKDALAAVGR
jgi:hypothetical protein